MESLKLLNNELMEDVRNYNLCILESSDINNDIDENLQKYITLLYHSDTVQWRAILLSVLRKYKSVNDFSKQKQLINIVEEVFEIIFTMVADNNARFNLIEQDFPKFAKQINSSESFDLILTNIKNFKEEKRLSFKNAEIDIRDFENNKFCAMFLLMYRFNIDILSVKNKKWTVEHILPQKPKFKDWHSIFPDLFSDNNKAKDQANEDYIYNIGNMTLLEGKQNKSLGNLSFEKKKKKLIENNIVDIIDEKSKFNFKNVDEWNANVINGRYEEIKNNISKTFKGIKF